MPCLRLRSSALVTHHNNSLKIVALIACQPILLYCFCVFKILRLISPEHFAPKFSFHIIHKTLLSSICYNAMSRVKTGQWDKNCIEKHCQKVQCYKASSTFLGRISWFGYCRFFELYCKVLCRSLFNSNIRSVSPEWARNTMDSGRCHCGANDTWMCCVSPMPLRYSTVRSCYGWRYWQESFVCCPSNLDSCRWMEGVVSAIPSWYRFSSEIKPEFFSVIYRIFLNDRNKLSQFDHTAFFSHTKMSWNEKMRESFELCRTNDWNVSAKKDWNQTVISLELQHQLNSSFISRMNLLNPWKRKKA